jgi:Zn-dependent M28 family amino/carboxypeptidase
MNSPEITESRYVDADYALPGDTAIINLPCFILGTKASGMLFDETGIVLTDIETRTADLLAPASTFLPGKRMRFTVGVKSESLVVRNVLGMIRGKDSTKSIVVGAHYDHLGIRNGNIYNGADDNASGVAGMLALAKVWCEYDEQPAFNIIFAAWTAEEKGLLGSCYYVMHSNANPEQLLLYINLDMISRSAPEDTACRQLSIGTMTTSDELKQIARASNLRLPHPFELDLWDVTGHFGSDYSFFAVSNIPVMTFFSGFHDDYHSPRDIAAKADLQKMENILKIANYCLWEVTQNSLDK